MPPLCSSHPLQEQFLLHYSERAKALTEEARALKDVQTEARRAVVGARRKLQALAQRLREEMGRKEVGGWVEEAGRKEVCGEVDK